MDNIIDLSRLNKSQAPEPEYKTYVFTYEDGSTVEETGYLSIFGMVAGVGRGEGEIQLVVPLEKLRHVAPKQTENVN